jgi:hypothetical protein
MIPALVVKTTYPMLLAGNSWLTHFSKSGRRTLNRGGYLSAAAIDGGLSILESRTKERKIADAMPCQSILKYITINLGFVTALLNGRWANFFC